MGAALSMLDAVTDIYIISKYYNTEGLRGQSNAMVVMIVTNMGIQILVLLAQYKKKSWGVKVKEVLICLFFLRPVVDAFRVSMNHKDNEVTFDPLVEIMFNKVSLCCELLEHQNIRADNTTSLLLIYFAVLFFFGHAGCRACL